MCVCVVVWNNNHIEKEQFPLKIVEMHTWIYAHKIDDQTDYDHWTDGG